MSWLEVGVAIGVTLLFLYGTPPKKRRLGQPTHLQSPFADREEEEKITESDVFVVGGAAAGLSIAACLKQQGISNIVVEKYAHSGDQWRKRYHRLHLHDIIEECQLPGFNMPDDYPIYPTRHQFADYLDSYARCLRLDVRYQHEVKSATFNEGSKTWTIKVDDNSDDKSIVNRVFTAKHLVIANGVYNDPKIPEIQGIKNFKGPTLHSSSYTNATQIGLNDKKVLVVGFGNSGAEIVLDLIEHGAHPTILQRSPIAVMPRKFMQILQTLRYRYVNIVYLPFSYIFLPLLLIAGDISLKIFSRLTFGNLKKHNITIDWRPPLLRMLLTFNPPLMDVGTIECIRSGKALVKATTIEEVMEDGEIKFADGSAEHFDGIVYATGFSPVSGHAHFLDPKLCEKIGSGFQAVRKKEIITGRECKSVPQLWFIWGRLQMIRDIAPSLAMSIKKRLGGPTPIFTRLRLLIAYHVVLSGACIYFIVKHYA